MPPAWGAKVEPKASRPTKKPNTPGFSFSRMEVAQVDQEYGG